MADGTPLRLRTILDSLPREAANAGSAGAFGDLRWNSSGLYVANQPFVLKDKGSRVTGQMSLLIPRLRHTFPSEESLVNIKKLRFRRSERANLTLVPRDPAAGAKKPVRCTQRGRNKDRT